MASSPKPHADFTVTSSCLCYGELNNIWHGASSPRPQQGLPAASPQPAVTVLRQLVEYNLPAKNGKWIAYQLVKVGTTTVCAWFVAHEDVDPVREADKILQVCGSPYEGDGRSSWNDERTRAEGVLVINRYDWGSYDKRAQDIFSIDYDETYIDVSISAGLVDYDAAKVEVERWKLQPAKERGQQSNGIWLYIPDSEYMFGRFGFNEDHSLAQSFLFFSTYTVFTETAFEGTGQSSLRKNETDLERLERRLREGFDFSGLGVLEMMGSGLWKMDIPDESEYLGPYDEAEHVLDGSDIDAILQLVVREGPGFVDTWTKHVHVLLNELILSYLERTILPVSRSSNNLLAAAELIASRHDTETNSKSIDSILYKYMTDSIAQPIVGFDTLAAESRIHTFLKSRTGGHSDLVEDAQYIAGLSRCTIWLISETLEMAGNSAKDSHRPAIMPVDIRIALSNDLDLLNIFKYSKMFWKGSAPVPLERSG